MKGYQPVLAMRMKGVMPASVSVSTDPQPADWSRWPEFMDRALVKVEAGDSLARLDLRWLVGMPLVFVDGTDPARVAAVAEACTEAGAKRVVATTLVRQPWGYETARVADTEGVLTWQA